MTQETIVGRPPLDLRAGDWVEVRTHEQILATLDENASVDNLPFMPEMLRYCGKRFLVYKRADKTCDTITGKYTSRRMHDAVHLADVRCDGEAHGGCDTTCLIFWKEVWLKRVDETENLVRVAGTEKEGQLGNSRCSIENLMGATRATRNEFGEEEPIYFCQATALLKATSPLVWWDVRQYWREWRSGNIRVEDIAKYLSTAVWNWVVGRRGIGRINYLITGHRRYPFMNSKLMLDGNTPYEKLGLQPGELVDVKRVDEILMTLKKWRNRGLSFDQNGEMLKYCGGKFKVLKIVRKVIDEKSGKLLVLKNEGVILDGVICCGHYSPNRLLCPRSQYPFWREIWLQRTDGGSR